MIELSEIDFSAFDRPEILTILFHPRAEWYEDDAQRPGEEVLIPVEKSVVVGGRFHLAGKSSPTILFFHGNGEIVADYDEIGQLYNRMGINFFPVDYRGYGRSTGRPSVTNMMRDAHLVFKYISHWRKENGWEGPFVVMGRSLGSASALELAAHYWSETDGLIIESGFARVAPLMRLLGVDMEALGIGEEQGFGNMEKIRRFAKPTLIIHAERDHIIPYAEGKALYEASSSGEKRFLTIFGANHNDIFLRGMGEYMEAVAALVKGIHPEGGK